ncbi:MAG: preprotein translocase subunit YajC [Bacteroidetes bacterium GWF2_43_63]|nr:MAG: preprotein translocase subunit YajC [Bacteroidetes bacterium GWE2_42_42]OFY53602.1 MAG: preprotein translocase subunit YajC [Bacteroidetes bacterium GWF2_43_63]HBG71065.1 preprotein translocase subunit YajC [Bacteroidales bacterium]HCB63643.1 preprotein translocase subunit YajC [Bacteroidales bacterium]HCY24392.1 preprotein translocase subunit YajC [Bacteroidales bacterium]
MNFAYILLLSQQTADGESSGGWTTMVMLLLLVVVFWLFFIRPQSKKNKEITKFRQGLKKGDRVITIGGIHGKILEINDTTAIIETEGQGKLKLEKNAIAQEFKAEEMAEK